MKKTKISTLLAISVLLGTNTVLADGTETLGAPSIDIVRSDDVVVAGTGLLNGPSTIFVDVPGRVKQVLLYWEGESRGDPSVDDIDGDETIEVNGLSVVGDLIGGPNHVVKDRYSSAYRADITSLGLVSRGSNALDISGLDITTPHGAGVAVLHDKHRYEGEVILRDGADLALSFREPKTEPQVFSIQPSTNDRLAKLSLFSSGVAGDTERLGFRPSAVYVTIGDNTTTYDNILDSVSGPEWDTITLDNIVIPAFEDTVTIQLESVDNLGIGTNPYSPASFTLTLAALSVEVERGCHTYRKHHKSQKKIGHSWGSRYSKKSWHSTSSWNAKKRSHGWWSRGHH